MAMIKKFKNLISYAKITGRKIQAKNSLRQRKKWLKEKGIKYQRLNKQQRNQVRALWGKKSDFSLHEIFLSLYGTFNPDYCPYRLMLADVGIKLNNQDYVTAWDDKNFYDILFSNIATFPKSLIHNISGVFLDENYRTIEEINVYNILKDYDTVIIKPSIESGDGRGVLKIHPIKDDLQHILKLYKKDYIIQKVIQQYKPISAINQTSVNVIRFNTVSLGGRVIPLSAGLKCGSIGAITDNYVSKDGGGMFIIGINDDGTLKSTAYHMNGSCISQAPNGFSFSQMQIPKFDQIRNLVVRMHEMMPMFMFIGFDIAIDESGSPIIMEYNIKGPGVFLCQYANGPLFGSHTNEVIQYLRSKSIIK